MNPDSAPFFIAIGLVIGVVAGGHLERAKWMARIRRWNSDLAARR